MRFLHTADWHIGRPFAVNRLPEQESVLAEILDIAAREQIDCVLVSGDLFDSRGPSAEAERTVYTFFADLVKRGIAAVIIGGNHDHPKRLDALRRLLDPLRIWIRPEPAAPDSGGVVEVPSRGEVARIAALPFVSERRIVDACAIMAPEQTWYASYEENVAAMMETLARSFSGATINILMAHVFAIGSETSGSEWAIHTGLPYAVSPARFPAGAQYIALGHLHRPQEIPAPAPCQYAGSPMQLDFGEQGQKKRVAIIEARPGRPARVDSIPLTKGRELCDIEGRLDRIEDLAGPLAGAWLRVTVLTEGPVPGLAEKVRERLPNAVYVRSKHASADAVASRTPRGQLKPDALFAEFYRRQHGAGPEAELLKLFNELYEESIHEAE